MRTLRSGGIGVACACGLLLGSTSGADTATPADIAKVWAEREKKVKSCRVAWSEVTTYPKGSFYAAPLAKPEDAPAKDVTISATCKLLLDGNKSRYEFHGQRWSTKNKKLEPDVSIVVFDGTRVARTTVQTPLIGNPQVTLKNATTYPQGGWPQYVPIWLTARPSVIQKRIPIEQFVATGRKESIYNQLCSEFILNVRGGERKQVLVDLERDCQVVRYADYFADNKLNIKLEITYRVDTIMGWVPTVWDFVLCTRKGEIEMSTRCVVSEFVANVDVPSSEFEAVLPTGARVIDNTSGTEMHSAILPTGERGKSIEFVPGKSDFPSYEQLIAQPPERNFWVRVWPWALASAGLLILGSIAWRLRRGRRMNPPAS